MLEMTIRPLDVAKKTHTLTLLPLNFGEKKGLDLRAKSSKASTSKSQPNISISTQLEHQNLYQA